MMHKWFWKFSSQWDVPRGAYVRQVVSDSDALLNTVEQCKPWKGKVPLPLRSDRSTKLEDFPMCAIPILSSNAVLEVEDLLGKDGEFVPVVLRCKGREVPSQYHLYNCLRKVDALDLTRTDPAHVQSDGQLRAGVPLRLAHARVPDAVDAFRCEGKLAPLLVSDRVATRLRDSKLCGWGLMDPEAPPLGRPSVLSPFRP
jgi:hypothetical protein